MSKSIKVSQKNYDRLVKFMRPRESFDDVVSRLLRIHEVIGQLEDIIEGRIAFEEGKRERFEKTPAPH